MKRIVENWKQRIMEIRENSVATKGRTTGFQVIVMMLLMTALSYFTWYIIKTILTYGP